MIIDCISDLHGFQPILEGGDLLICAGDCVERDKVKEWMAFFEWFKAQPYEYKVLIGGNHDGFLEKCVSSEEAKGLLGSEYDSEGIEYLCDSGACVKGIRIWGSPWTPRFYNWHFMLSRGERIRQKWELIPDDTQILVTHGPPRGVMDTSYRGDTCGCEDLGNRMKQLEDLKLHVFGHIHEGYGVLEGTYKSVNCSIMDREYKPVNKPIRVVL